MRPFRPLGLALALLGSLPMAAKAELGRYLYCASPDAAEAEGKSGTGIPVASLKDENGKPFASSKFIEVHMDGDKLVNIGSEFGLGRAG